MPAIRLRPRLCQEAFLVKRWRARRKTFLTIARGSVQRFDISDRREPVEGECVPLLELARRRGLLEDAGHGKLKDDVG